MDSYLNILSLALSIGAFAPLVYNRRKSKGMAIAIAAVSLLILIGCYQTYQYFANERAVQQAKDGMVSSLKDNPGGMTFDDLINSSYYQSNDIANAAIDELVYSGQVTQAQAETSDKSGNVYRIRRYRLSSP